MQCRYIHIDRATLTLKNTCYYEQTKGYAFPHPSNCNRPVFLSNEATQDLFPQLECSNAIETLTDISIKAILVTLIQTLLQIGMLNSLLTQHLFNVPSRVPFLDTTHLLHPRSFYLLFTFLFWFFIMKKSFSILSCITLEMIDELSPLAEVFVTN